MTTPQIFQLNPHTEPTNVPPSKPSNLPSPLGDSFDSPRQHRNYLTPTTIYFTQPHIFSSFLHSLYFLFHFLSTRRLIWLFISLSSSSFVRLFIYFCSVEDFSCSLDQVPWLPLRWELWKKVGLLCMLPSGWTGGRFTYRTVSLYSRECYHSIMYWVTYTL
jgi:hypothetical protein